MLKQISIRVYPEEKRPFYQFYTGGIEELYFSCLEKINLDAINYINVYFTNSDKETQKIVSNFLDVDTYFNFGDFEKLETAYQKKKAILESLHGCMIKLCARYNWDTIPFKAAYKKCLDRDLNYSWFFKRKLFRSPDKKHYFGMWHEVDLGKCQIFEVLFNGRKEELTRRLCFQDKVDVFHISYASWEEHNDKFYYKFNGPKKNSKPILMTYFQIKN